MAKTDDREVLERFNERISRLEATRIHKRYAESLPQVVALVQNVSIGEFKDGKGEFTAHFRSWLDEFDQDDVDAFVLSYRLVTQNNDRLSIRSIAKIYERDWIPTEAREKFDEARIQFNNYLDNTTTFVDVGSPILIRELLDVIIYGVLAHSNPTKEVVFRDWCANGGMTGFIWAEFIASIKEAMRYLMYFKELNAAVLCNTQDAD